MKDKVLESDDISVQIGVLNTHLRYIKDQNDEIKKSVEELRKIGVTKTEVREIKSDVSSIETRVELLERKQAVFDDSFINKLGKGWETAIVALIVSSLIFVMVKANSNHEDMNKIQNFIQKESRREKR